MANRASEPATADAAGLPLCHRMFPRAMAWNVQRQNASSATEQLVLVAAQVLEQQSSRVDTMDVARSFPLLQASVASVGDEEESYRRALEARVRPVKVPRAPPAAKGVERERLFRTMGKYLDGTTTAVPSRTAQTSRGYVKQRPVYYQAPPPPPIRRSYGGMPSPDRMTAEQQTAFQAMKISTYAEEEQRSWATRAQVPSAGMRSPPPAFPTTPSGLYQIRLRSPPSATSGKKRTRGSTPETIHTTGSTTTVGKDEIAPSLARSLLTGCGAKQCSFEGCKKIAVSKGLCRGHGGGRRCQHVGCTKCAQSRSPFCWAHGGGKRCEAPNCRRSRKTKRFCVDHVDMELVVPQKPEVDNVPKPVSVKAAKSAAKSLSSNAKTSSSCASAESDDSVGRQSTVSCDSYLSVANNKENERMLSAAQVVGEHKYLQYDQHARAVSGVFAPPLQLPSLNEALLRAVPTQYSWEAMWSSTRTPSPAAPLSSQYKSEYRSWPGNSN